MVGTIAWRLKTRGRCWIRLALMRPWRPRRPGRAALDIRPTVTFDTYPTQLSVVGYDNRVYYVSHGTGSCGIR